MCKINPYTENQEHIVHQGNIYYYILNVSSCLLCFSFQYPVILLAGEATHERYFSTTHGAYETGQAQAKVILDYISSQRSSSLQKTNC
jgi:hypothetical protein